ncbi:MAG TPA: globin domain-containing protein [Mycobacterium sp.]|nr:globin domain-containing protein [Mycobacterium sp.]
MFAAASSVEPLFAGVDLKRQKAMLLTALALWRNSLRDLDAVVPKLRELGARHPSYGARPEHYPLVGEVLIASMAETAGHTWCAEYDHAWREALSLVAAAMLEGADRVSLETV